MLKRMGFYWCFWCEGFTQVCEYVNVVRNATAAAAPRFMKSLIFAVWKNTHALFINFFKLLCTFCHPLWFSGLSTIDLCVISFFHYVFLHQFLMQIWQMCILGSFSLFIMSSLSLMLVSTSEQQKEISVLSSQTKLMSSAVFKTGSKVFCCLHALVTVDCRTDTTVMKTHQISSSILTRA